MDQQSIPTSLAPEVIIEQVLGGLQVKGWERSEVVIKANPDELTLEEQDDVIRLSCRGDCAVRLPHGATLQVESVHGDARFKLLEDQLSIEAVHGSLVLRNVADTNVGSVHGELQAKYVAGDLRVEDVSGNLNGRGIQGQCILNEVAGNLDLRDVDSSVLASTKGNARLRLSTMAGENYRIQAAGNVTCRIPENVDAHVLLSSDAQNISVKLPGESKTVQQDHYELNLGSGLLEVDISAGGTLYFSSQEVDWDQGEDQDFDPTFASISEEFNQQIAQQIESQIEAQMETMTRNLNEHLSNLSSTFSKAGLSEEQTEQILRRARESSERATARAQERMQRAQEKLERKLEAARRRNELKAQASERRAQLRGKRSWNFEWPASQPTSPAEPVSDEERLIILRMLEEKKITLEEAEKLLSALEGK